MSRRRAASAALLLLAGSVSLFAQLGPSGRAGRFPADSPADFGDPSQIDVFRSSSLTGVVHDRAHNPMDNVGIELRNPATGATLTSTYTRPDGSFELKDLPSRTYEMVVTYGVSEVRQRLDVPRGEFQLSVQMPILIADHSGPATVSVSELKVPGKARDEVQKAEQKISSKPDDARKELTRALEIAPKYGKAHMLLGLLNLMQRRIKEATRELEAAIHYDPGNARAFVALASAYNTQQRYPDAVRALDSGTRLAPAAWQTYFEMSRAKLGMKDFKAALEQATKAEALCPEDNPDIHSVKASALIGLRDYQSASGELEKLLHLSPEGPQAEEARRTLAQIKAVDTARK